MESHSDAEVIPGCAMCKHPERESLERQIAQNFLLKTDLAGDLGVGIEDIIEHMDNHFALAKRRRPSEDRLREIIDKREILTNVMLDINDRLGNVLDAGDIGATATNQIVKLAGEVRQSVLALAKLEGELQTEQRITINQYNDLREIYLSALCPECKKNVLDAITIKGAEAATNV